MTQRFKYLGNNEYGLDVYRDRHNDFTYVNIPHTHVGHGSMVLHKANNKAISEDTERCEKLGIVDMYDVSGTFLGAIVGNYAPSQWILLEELVSDLNEYSVYDETLYYEMEHESQLEAITDMLEYDNAEVEPSAVLEAIFELDLYFVEEEGELWFITEHDLKHAKQYAMRNKP